MIASVEGSITAIGTDYLVVNNHGIGLKVFVPRDLVTSAELFKEVSLHTFLLVREDALTLYGFGTASDRDFFVLLL
jgi:Holliday junction DNA helicase RuvA